MVGNTKHICTFGLVLLLLWSLSGSFYLGKVTAFQLDKGCHESHHLETTSGCHYTLFHAKAEAHERCDHKEHLVVAEETTQLLGIPNPVKKWHTTFIPDLSFQVGSPPFLSVCFHFLRVNRIQNHTTRPPPSFA